MFVSAGRDLKFHSLTDQDIHLGYKPNCNTPIKSLSWAKDNGFLTFVTTKGPTEIISIRDPNHIKNVHTITSIDNATVVAFQRMTKRYLGIGAELGQVAIYDTRSKSISKLLQSTSSSVCCLDFNCDDRNLAVCSKTGSIVIYDVQRGLVSETYVASTSCQPTTMRYHPSLDHVLAVALDDGTVTQWDTHTNKKKYSSKVHLAAVTGIVLMENSNLLLSVGIDNKFSIQDVNTQESTFSCNQPYPLTAIDASFDGITIAMGSEYGDIYIYDIRQLIKPLNKLKPHLTKVNKILFENRIKDEYLDESSEFLSISTCESKEQVVESPALQPTVAPMPLSLPPPLDVKYSYLGKNISKLDVDRPIIGKELMDELATDLRSEVHKNIRKGRGKLEQHLKTHVSNLEKFMSGEFQTMFDIIDEKFEYFNNLAETRLAGSSRRSSN